MKTGRNIVFFLLLFNISNICQDLTGYYPLEIGNMWEYWDPYEDIFLSRSIVVGDTIMPNGISYSIIKVIYASSSNPRFGFQRQDGSIVYQYDEEWVDSERVLYDYSKTSGDTLWVWNYQDDTIIYKITFDYYDYFYGKFCRFIEHYEKSTNTSIYTIDRIADSIGRVYLQFEPDIAYYLYGAVINGIKYGNITDAEGENISPKTFYLSQNYPNPFNSYTKIEFYLPRRKYITLKVFDILGKLVDTLVDGEKESGTYRIFFNAKGIAGGVYIYQLKADNYFEAKKMIFLP